MAERENDELVGDAALAERTGPQLPSTLAPGEGERHGAPGAGEVRIEGGGMLVPNSPILPQPC